MVSTMGPENQWDQANYKGKRFVQGCWGAAASGAQKADGNSDGAQTTNGNRQIERRIIRTGVLGRRGERRPNSRPNTPGSLSASCTDGPQVSDGRPSPSGFRRSSACQAGRQWMSQSCCHSPAADDQHACSCVRTLRCSLPSASHPVMAMNAHTNITTTAGRRIDGCAVSERLALADLTIQLRNFWRSGHEQMPPCQRRPIATRSAVPLSRRGCNPLSLGLGSLPTSSSYVNSWRPVLLVLICCLTLSKVLSVSSAAVICRRCRLAELLTRMPPYVQGLEIKHWMRRPRTLVLQRRQAVQSYVMVVKVEHRSNCLQRCKVIPNAKQTKTEADGRLLRRRSKATTPLYQMKRWLLACAAQGCACTNSEF